MSTLWKNFIYSIRLPQKQAVFSLNRIGMDITVIYMFILLALISVPALIEQLGENKTADIAVQPFFYIIFFFFVYYLVLVVIVFGLLSLIGYIGTLIASAMGRKLRFSLMWKMAASATTIPLLCYLVISLIYPLSSYFLLLSLIYIIFILVRVILIYPRRKKR